MEYETGHTISELATSWQTSPHAERILYKPAEETLVEDEAILLPVYYYANGKATQPNLLRTYDDDVFGGYIADGKMGWQLFLPVILKQE